MAAGLPGGDRVHHHLPHRGEHAVDPPGTPHRKNSRPRQHHARRRRAGPRSSRHRVSQPGHEQPELLRPRLPGPARPGTPAQEQRDRVRITLGRGLRAIAAEPHLPQEAVRNGTTARSSSSTVQYLAPDGSLTGNARIRDPPGLAGLPEQLPATSATPGETRRRTCHMTGSGNITRQAGDPW